MWRLNEFRFDEQIDADEVYVFDDSFDGLEPMTREAAIALAHSKGVNLVASWPAGAETDRPTCILSKVSVPLRWERVPGIGERSIDEDLWFESSCGGRDFLLEGQGHTFRGRMSAWCPTKQVSYRVSLSEMGEMSEATRYFVRGYLSGSAPDWPKDDEGVVDPGDLTAWRSAVGRYLDTGTWYGRWGTCEVCGCVLLPDTADARCGEHLRA